MSITNSTGGPEIDIAHSQQDIPSFYNYFLAMNISFLYNNYKTYFECDI